MVIALDGTDAVLEGTWLTSEGSTLPYLTWEPGEPNGGEVADCMSMQRDLSQGLADGDCEFNYFSVCEKSSKKLVVQPYYTVRSRYFLLHIHVFL